MSNAVFKGHASGTGTVTLETPNTNSDRTISLPDAAGTVMVSGNMPAFSAYRNADQTGISANTWTKIQYNAENFDTANCYDPTTNYRFTPNVAGYYQVSASGALSGASTYTYFAIYKNGASVIVSPYSGAGGVGGVAVGLISMNGTTDYLEGYIFRDGTQNLTGGASGYTMFQGVLTRAA